MTGGVGVLAAWGSKIRLAPHHTAQPIWPRAPRANYCIPISAYSPLPMPTIMTTLTISSHLALCLAIQGHTCTLTHFMDLHHILILLYNWYSFWCILSLLLIVVAGAMLIVPQFYQM